MHAGALYQSEDRQAVGPRRRVRPLRSAVELLGYGPINSKLIKLRQIWVVGILSKPAGEIPTPPSEHIPLRRCCLFGPPRHEARTALFTSYRLSLLAAAVSQEQLREVSAPSNRNFDSTTAGVCVAVKRGLRLAVRVARPGRHSGPRLLGYRLSRLA